MISFKMGVFGKTLLFFFYLARLREKCARLRAARGRRRGNNLEFHGAPALLVYNPSCNFKFFLVANIIAFTMLKWSEA